MDADIIIENLTELLTNTVNMTSVFYDIFLNPEPIDVQLQQYNDKNQLVTVTIPNRAKDSQVALSDSGSPEGNVSAPTGAVYIDNDNYKIYVKVMNTSSEGYSKDGWQLIPTSTALEDTIANYLINNSYVRAVADDKATSDTFGVVKIDDDSIITNSNNQIEVSKIANTNNNGKVQVWVGTQDEYDIIADKDPNTLYYIIEA